MKTTFVNFELTGTMPLLMHADDILQADRLTEWRKDPANKNRSNKGDDRSPAWTWQAYCYNDGRHIVMPCDNIMVALRQAGAQMTLIGKKTFKEITQSGLIMATEYCEFRSDGKQVPVEFLKTIRDSEFSTQANAVEQFGFSLFCKRARVGMAKHIRVRPRFENWSVSGRLEVIAPEITREKLVQLFDLAGRCGLCDWRPGCKFPGPFGMFSTVLK